MNSFVELALIFSVIGGENFPRPCPLLMIFHLDEIIYLNDRCYHTVSIKAMAFKRIKVRSKLVHINQTV